MSLPAPVTLATPDVRLYVGGHGSSFAALSGDRCFSAAHDAGTVRMERPRETTAIIDSGAFTDGPADRLTPAQALTRQLVWERAVAWRSGAPLWRAQALVSYDLLIDETWVAGAKHKRRWSVADAERAIEVTVDAAAYLASQRVMLAPRRLILSAQGVDAMQYRACMESVLQYATPVDWIGLGGWCILGRFTSWLPTFWATLYEVLPLIAAANIRQVHLFGVLYQPALGGLLWLADRHGLSVSVDSSAPARSGACTTETARKRAGCRADSMEGNVAWWIHRLATLRQSSYYRQPPHVPALRQRTLWEMIA
jgi:hypothetical protein